MVSSISIPKDVVPTPYKAARSVCVPPSHLYVFHVGGEKRYERNPRYNRSYSSNDTESRDHVKALWVRGDELIYAISCDRGAGLRRMAKCLREGWDLVDRAAIHLVTRNLGSH